MLHVNAHCRRDIPWGERQRRVLDEVGAAQALAEITAWPGYAPTPLTALPGFAERLGLASVHYKDEGGRFGLGSFKALGGAYAVYRLLAAAVRERTGDTPTSRALAAGEHRDITSELTVCCATDGNHGRSVAWGAQTFGCACVIYLHATVSEGREAAIARFGARIQRTAGGYDDSVREAAADAESNGWTVVSDTSWEGYTDIPRDVMTGYTVMADETVQQFGADVAPDFVVVPGGVGGVAAAVLARYWWQYGERRPKTIVVEPERAACLYVSARAGRRVALEGEVDTVMAGLCCGETSLLAFGLLLEGAEGYVTLPDDAALAMMRTLADGVDGDPPVVSGESAAAGPAALEALMADAQAASSLGLGADSSVVVFGTEGDTDPVLYEQIVGRSGNAVRGEAA